MSRFASHIRYAAAVGALLGALVMSIRFSDRGFLFDPQAGTVMAGPTSAQPGYDLQSLSVLTRVLLQMKDNYVEPERIDARRMLLYSLDSVQNGVPEVVALFDGDMDDPARYPALVEVRVGAHRQTFQIQDVKTIWELTFKLREIFRFVQSRLQNTDVDLRDVEYAAINGILSTLDPHSVLLTPDIYEDMEASNRGSFGGLGIVISLRNNELTVISPIADTPAHRAGFKAGDRIVKINDESTVNMPLDDAVNRLRGPPGTKVTLQILRTGWMEPHEFELQREVIQIESVKSRYLGDKLGYVEIRSFQQNTHDDLRKALRALRTEAGGELRGLVLDMRNNPGGLLQQAVRISNTFIDRGTLVTTVGVGNKLREENVAEAGKAEPLYPIVVLVNPGSASASEIVAGALKNHNRALIVGDRTFGKGSVQMLYPYDDGSALKLTVAQYLTPGDVSIQGVGIVPDIQILPVGLEDDRIDLYESEFVRREGELEAHLTSEKTTTGERPTAVVRYYEEPTEFDPDAIVDPDEFRIDFEIGFARRLLLAAGDVYERTTLLGKLGEIIDRTAVEQMIDIQERLRKRGVDWASGDNIVQTVTMKAETDKRDHRVEAGSTVKLSLTVRNEGKSPLFRVRAVSMSDHPAFADLEFVFGRLDPGQKRTWTVPIKVPADDASRIESVRFRTWADNIPLSEGGEIFVTVRGLTRPHFGLSWRIDDTASGNGDGLLQAGETVRFIVDVHNVGDGDARKTMVVLRNRSDASLFLTRGRSELPKVPAGSAQQVEFEFQVKSRPENGKVRFSAEVLDTELREYVSEDLQIDVFETAGRPEETTGILRTRAEGAPIVIRAGASATYPPVATAPNGAHLAFNRVADGWYHVTWDGGAGWIQSEDGLPDTEARKANGKVALRVAYLGPEIDLGANALETRGERFDLRGTIRDDREVRDYYVIVSSKVGTYRFRSLKRAYEFVGAPEVAIAQSIPLRPGMNRITVAARDDDRVTSTETIFVYRRE